MLVKLLKKYSIAILFILSLLSCGPIKTVSVLVDTQVLLDTAKTADAQKWAPYEYYSALQYYEKAKEERGQANYEDAIRLATEASKFAQAAIKKAKEATGTGK